MKLYFILLLCCPSVRERICHIEDMNYDGVAVLNARSAQTVAAPRAPRSRLSRTDVEDRAGPASSVPAATGLAHTGQCLRSQSPLVTAACSLSRETGLGPRSEGEEIWVMEEIWVTERRLGWRGGCRRFTGTTQWEGV